MHIILTLNLPEPPPQFEPRKCSFTLIENASPQGFAENHNAAFARSSGDYFCVMNPDLRLRMDSLQPLLKRLGQRPGVAGPRVVTPDGQIEDSARRIPTVWRLLVRRIGQSAATDYNPALAVQDVDWLAGMCLMFDRGTYGAVQGFDERFHLYCEDVHLCLKIHLGGGHVSWVQDATVVHEAQRASHRDFRYLGWHLKSLAKLFLSSAYWQFRFSKRISQRVS
ncbi:glycosyltransferase [Cupriavidus necator]|uniref:glycosyltransferase n=1 Tax=Cupriavidus necator TaxID=106590 RepID=UPI003F740B42